MTEKDLLYLSDAFNWNLIALKNIKYMKNSLQVKHLN